MVRQLIAALALTLISCASAPKPNWPVSSKPHFCEDWSNSAAELATCQEYGFILGRGISAATLLEIERVIDLPEKQDVLRVQKKQGKIDVTTGSRDHGDSYSGGHKFYFEKKNGQWIISHPDSRIRWVT